MDVVIGTAGWSIPRANTSRFPAEGTALARYATVFGGVEVNSAFYRPHRPSTWARWAASVPEAFRFAVKIPKAITHEARLVGAEDLIARFADEVAPLGDRLALVLAQLPPKLSFDAAAAERFFRRLRRSLPAQIVCEPRHPGWFTREADRRLDEWRVARAAADPPTGGPEAATPGGWRGLSYWRLHGSPTLYRSAYDAAALDAYAQRIRDSADAGRPSWCVFDNTAASAATGDALALQARLRAATADPR